MEQSMLMMLRKNYIKQMLSLSRNGHLSSMVIQEMILSLVIYNQAGVEVIENRQFLIIKAKMIMMLAKNENLSESSIGKILDSALSNYL